MTSVFIYAQISQINLANFAQSEQVKAEFEVKSGKTRFNFPFENMILMLDISEIDSVMLRLTLREKTVAVTRFSLKNELSKESLDLVLFDEVAGKEGIEGNEGIEDRKRVVGSLNLALNREYFDEFVNEADQLGVFAFGNEEIQEILKFLQGNRRAVSCEESCGDFSGFCAKSDGIDRRLKKVQTLIRGLNQKLKVLEIYQAQKAKMREVIRQRDLVIQELGNKINENLKAYQGIKLKFEEFSEIQKQKINQQIKTIQSLEQNIKSLKDENLKFKIDIDFLKAELAKAHDQARLIKDYEQMVTELRKVIRSNEESIERMNKEFKINQDLFQENLAKHQNEIEFLIMENQSLDKKAKAANEKVHALEGRYEQLNIEYLEIKYSKMIDRKFEVLIEDLENKSDMFEKSSKEFKDEAVILKEQLEKQNKRFMEVSKESQKEKLHIHKSAKVLSTEINDLKIKLTQKESEIQKKSSLIIDLSSKHLPVRDYSSLEALSNRSILEINIITSSYAKYEKDHNIQSDFLVNSYISLSQRHLILERNLKRIISLLREKEKEIPILREMISELKSRELYMPVSGDIIDNYLANYINSRSDKLAVPFVRLYHGMYVFGSKKVSMKIENSGIVSN